MFGPMQPTPLDFEFSLGGVPVKVSGWFWAVAVIFGWNQATVAQGGHPVFLLGFMIAMFLSILLHELGHVLAFRAFGIRAAVMLIQFGGLAIPMNRRALVWWQSVIVSLAGPAIQIAAGFAASLAPIAVVVAGLTNQLAAEFLVRIVSGFAQVSIFWGVLNLLPIFPLDGGKICEALCRRFLRSGSLWTHRIGMLTGVLAGLAFLKLGAIFGVILFFYLAYENYQALERIRH